LGQMRQQRERMRYSADFGGLIRALTASRMPTVGRH
jgi:hypothetical protein